MSRQGMIAACGLPALVLLSAVGCQSQQSVASNPFLSNDRVPPPGTRTPAPGTAEPYYPNDQLPAAPVQSAAPAAPPQTFAAAPVTSAPAPSGGEGPIAVPTDDQTLRPAPAPAASMIATAPAQRPAPQASQSPPFSEAPQPTELAWAGGAPPRQIDPAAVQNAQPVAPATYMASTTPRVRLPGYSASASAAPQAAAPVTGRVQITELPPRPQEVATAPAGGQVASDGFQPRGTAVRKPLTPVSPGSASGVF